MSFLAAAGWTVGISVALALFVQMSESMRPGAQSDLVTVAGFYVVVHMLVIFGMLRVYEPETSLRESLGFRAVSPLAPILAAIAGAGCFPTLSALDGFVASRFPAQPEEEELLTKLLTADGLGARIFLFVAVVLLLPLAEEAFFRGTLYAGLKRGRPRAIALVATAGYFTFSHYDIRYFGSTLTLGLLVTWLRAESGSILPACAAHIAFLAVPAVPLVRNPAADDHFTRPWMIGSAAAAIVAFAALYALFRGDARAVAGRAADE